MQIRTLMVSTDFCLPNPSICTIVLGCDSPLYKQFKHPGWLQVSYWQIWKLITSSVDFMTQHCPATHPPAPLSFWITIIILTNLYTRLHRMLHGLVKYWTTQCLIPEVGILQREKKISAGIYCIVLTHNKQRNNFIRIKCQ